MYAVVDPATGETVRQFETITDEELDAAIGRADSAWRTWAGSLGERAAAIRRVGELHRSGAERLTRILMREMGKPISQALGEIKFTASIYDYYADTADELVADEAITLRGGSGTAVVRRCPLGVILGIMPWNYPFYQVARFAAPNLIIGNAVLLKPAPQCPESALALAEIFEEAGLDGGQYLNILASNDQIARTIADPRIRGVSLTGSERAGAAVAEIAGRHLKKVVLELGGSDPFIVLGTDDLDELVRSAASARLANAGQACNAAKRFVVVDELYEPFVEKFAAEMSARTPGDPALPETAMGPLSSAAAAARLEEQVRRAVEQGATLVTGGRREGCFFEPTVLTDIAPESEVAREEFFGPVAQVYRARDEQHAVRLANDIPFGLGSYVMTPDVDQAARVADQIEAGMVFVNTIDGEGVELPFGGVKNSGFGRELGRFGADEFVNKKLIRVG